MQENFEGYREELDQVKLTEESKRALVRSLQNRKEDEMRKNGRKPVRIRRVAAVAAVICLLTTGAVAAVTASPTLRDRIFGDSAAYEQSSAFIGRSVENRGWTVTITDCVGDDIDLYMGLEVTAPEGTVLEEGSYQFGDRPGDIALLFPDMENGRQQWGIRQLPDDDATDNKLNFILHSGNFLDEGSYNGQRMRLKIYDLRKVWYDAERQERVEEPVCNGTWDFGEMTVDLPHSTIRLEPNVSVHTLDVEAAITEIAISPISVQVCIEGNALKGHHGRVPKNAPDGYYGCIEYQEIVLYGEDGSAIAAEQLQAGSGCWGGGADSGEDGRLLIRRTYSRAVNDMITKLVDVDSPTAVSVCGGMIPLK